MTQAELKVSILADISQLERALTAAEKLLVQHQQNYDSVSRSITQTASRMREVGREAQNLRSAFNSGKISADQFEKEMNQLNKEVRQLDVEMSDLTREQTRLGREMQRTTRVVQQQRGGFSGVADGAEQASQGMRQMARTATVNAVPAMTSVSQIVQDMPYGIRGVANNIQQLTMQMGWLTTQAGGTRKALSALVGSLWGPAGLLLVVSLVTSALVEYGDVLFRTRNLSRDLRDATSDLVGSAQSEITVLQSLLRVARDEQESKENRQRAIDNINDRYGKYLGNLDLESVNTNKVTTAVDNLSQALIRQAKIRGVQELISEKAAEIAEKEAKAYEDAQKQIEEARRRSSVTSRETDPRLAPTGDEAERIEAALGNARQNLEKSIVDNALQEAASKAKQEMETLTDYINQLIEEDIEFKGVWSHVNEKGVESAGDLLKRLGIDPDTLQAELDAESLNFNFEDFDQQIQENMDKINKALNDAFTLYNTSILEDTLGLTSLTRDMNLAEIQFYGFEEAVDETSKEVSKSADRMRRALEMSIQGMIKSMLDGKFEAEDFAKSLIASFLSIGISNIFRGNNPFGGLFGGGAQAANFRMPSVNTSVAASGLNGAQLSVNIPDVRIDGQDLLVVFGRANQRKDRVG